jgi:alkylated DNA nucleotide flippase Atl1
MTHDEQIALVDAKLAGSPNDWQRKVFSLILRIPSGYLISYSQLAHCANKEFGLNLGPRNTAWLRGKLYGILGHDTDIPIHRIATQGDAESTKDHPYTQSVSREKRTAEGTYPILRWFTGSLK